MCSTVLFWLLLTLISLAVWGRQCPPKRFLRRSEEISLTAVCYPSYYAEVIWDNGLFQAENVRVHSSCYNDTNEMLQELIDSISPGDFSSSTTVSAEQWDMCEFSGCYVEQGVGRYFELSKVSCTWPVTDFDECSHGIHSCSINANCTDTSDSYNCTCHNGYEGNGTICTNINECERNLSNCDFNAKCIDTNGSFECNCTSGYYGNGYNCTNIDECTLGTHTCHDDAICTDTAGEYNCTCKLGFEGDGFNCTYIDECATNRHNCHQNATCNDTVGGFYCTCTDGYEGDGISCIDINECNDNPCHANASCINTPGNYSCLCDNGYTGDGKVCTNINECEQDNHECHLNATCTDTEGGYNCTCHIGFEGNGTICAESSSVVITLTMALTGAAAVIVVSVTVITLIVCVLRYQRRKDDWMWLLSSKVRWETDLVSIVPPTYPSMVTLVSEFDAFKFESTKESTNSHINNKMETIIKDTGEPPVDSSQLNEYTLSEGLSLEHEYVIVDSESSRITLSTSAQTETVQSVDHECFQTNSYPNNDIMSEGINEKMSNSNEPSPHDKSESHTKTALNQEGEKKQPSSSSSSSSLTNKSIADGQYVIFVDVQCQ